jgi:hypothetical protein
MRYGLVTVDELTVNSPATDFPPMENTNNQTNQQPIPINARDNNNISVVVNNIIVQIPYQSGNITYKESDLIGMTIHDLKTALSPHVGAPTETFCLYNGKGKEDSPAKVAKSKRYHTGLLPPGFE